MDELLFLRALIGLAKFLAATLAGGILGIVLVLVHDAYDERRAKRGGK